MENINKKTWEEFEKDSNFELKNKDAPYRLVSKWFILAGWVGIISLIIFLISVPILAYQGRFQDIDNSSIVLNSTSNINVEKTEVPVEIDDRDTNNYESFNNFTIINQIDIPENICNCT